MKSGPYCLVTLVTVLLGTSSCGSPVDARGIEPGREVEDTKQVAENTTIATRGVSLGFLVTREYEIEILSGRQGALFTVRSKEGQLLASDLSLPELAVQFPGLHQTVEGSYASGDPLWAGLEHSGPSLPGSAGK